MSRFWGQCFYYQVSQNPIWRDIQFCLHLFFHDFLNLISGFDFEVWVCTGDPDENCGVHPPRNECGARDRFESCVKVCCSIGFFSRISSVLQGSFAKETYNFKEPTNRILVFIGWALRRNLRKLRGTPTKKWMWRTWQIQIMCQGVLYVWHDSFRV